MLASPRERDRRPVLRVWVPVALSAVVQLGTTLGALLTHGAHWHPGAFGPPCCDTAAQTQAAAVPPWGAALLLLLALVGPALLVAIRRRPGPVLAAVALAAVAGGVVLFAAAGGVALYLSVPFAIVIAVRHGARVWAWAVTGVLWLTPLAVYLLTAQAGALFLLVPWTIVSIALLVLPEGARRRQAAREQLLRDAAARQAEEAQTERVRIARELHDVLAHSLSQINVQASVGLHLFDSRPEQAAAALANVKDTSRRALGEVRQVLGMLRGDAPLAPEQGLSGLDALIDELGAHGVDGVLTLRGSADVVRVPAAVQQAVYRIVQESLTNVTKHAAARHVTVEVVGDDERLTVRVVDDGVGAAASAAPDGRGLLGMRERAELLGGTFTAAPAVGGGFTVEAVLPMGGAA